MKYLSDFKQYGFKPAEIIAFLAKHGINIGDIDAMTEFVTTKNEDFPQWKKLMGLLPDFSHAEAAAALAGIDTNVPYYLGDCENIELRQWEDVITRAIFAGNLKAKETAWQDSFDATATAWKIKPADLMAWCAVNRITYPLPATTAFPQTDTGLRDALSASENELAQLKARVATLEAQEDQRAALQAELNNLRTELSSKVGRLTVISAERDKLKADVAEGKVKTTLLKIIGGLAMDGYGMDIHAQQLKGIGDMVKDLQLKGVDVTEKTLRERMQEAARLIDPPKEK